MSTKLIVLKNGINLISKVKEGYANDKLVCYLLENPCLIEINGSYRIAGEENKLSISLKSWPIFSKETYAEIDPDWIGVITNPTDDIISLYQNKVLEEIKNEINQNNLSNEQSDLNQSD